jgi:hypothetical protein
MSWKWTKTSRGPTRERGKGLSNTNSLSVKGKKLVTQRALLFQRIMKMRERKMEGKYRVNLRLLRAKRARKHG